MMGSTTGSWRKRRSSRRRSSESRRSSMARRMEYGNWAQVIGSFDLGARRGAILSMLPAKVAFASGEGGEERVRLKGLGEGDEVLFDLAVNPLEPSCGPT